MTSGSGDERFRFGLQLMIEGLLHVPPPDIPSWEVTGGWGPSGAVIRRPANHPAVVGAGSLLSEREPRHALTARPAAGSGDGPAPPERARTRWSRIPPWIVVSALVLLAAVAFVVLTGVRPAYDAYGWLVWGRQAVHLNLNLNAAPSWKPLPFLFTLPYSLIPGQAALWLWMVTAVAGAFAGSVFAGRIAYRLSAPAPRYARLTERCSPGSACSGSPAMGTSS